MATSQAQRAGIWIIAVVLTVGTIGGFIAMILAPKNQADDTARLQAAYTKYQKDQQAYQQKVTAQGAELSKVYYPEFSQYANVPAAFTAGDVKSLTTRDLKVGTGAEIKKDSAYSAYYIGWNPTGKVFDQSIDGQSLKAPIEGGNLIEGWNEGVVGMKVGGVRELTIPSDKAYGKQGSGEDIPANTPIKFVVMIIEKPENIKQPEVPKELMEASSGQ